MNPNVYVTFWIEGQDIPARLVFQFPAIKEADDITRLRKQIETEIDLRVVQVISWQRLEDDDKRYPFIAPTRKKA